ncbi:hypothetical protein Tco_1576898 [Tanacetum coccineum]
MFISWSSDWCMNKTCNWKPIIDKFHKRLTSWKARTLSYGGRLTLLKSVLDALGTYFFSIFMAPKCVINYLEKLRRLGIGSLHAANLAMLVKWWWRFHSEPNSLWKSTQFDLRPHMESDRWPQIYAGIQQHLQKIYNGKKAALKERYWVPEEDGTYDLERLRRGRPSHISEVNWDAQLAFWNDPKNLARAAQNKQNRAKSKVMETSATREYPSLIHTFFLTHTVGGVFLNPEDKALYDEMLRLQGLGSNTPTGVPYTEDEIMAIVRGGKQRGHIPGVGRVLPGQGTVIPPPSQSTHSTDIARLKKREKQLTKQVNMFMRLFRSDDKFSQMLNQFESQPEYGGGSGSGGCGDDEPGDDEDGGEDEEDEDDS